MEQQTKTETLIETANYLQRYGQPVPVDILARLLERGVDIDRWK
jgi:hypothetical protein